MDRRDRDRNERHDYGLDYSRYEGYRNDDAHYHSAKNLTNQFEQEYQRHQRTTNNDRYRSGDRYEQGRLGSAYDQYRREEGGFRNHDGTSPGNQGSDWDRNRNDASNFSRDRDRYSTYPDNFGGDQGINRRDQGNDRERHQELRGNIRQGYGISGFDGTSDRFNTLDSDDRKGTGQDEQAYYSGNRDGYRSARFGGGMGDAFPGSHRGVPDTSYGLRNFADSYGTGMGSSYGGSTGYSGGHRGGTPGNSSYGTTSGNYGGYGPMGGSTYGGGRSSYGNSSHNSDRGTSELGGF